MKAKPVTGALALSIVPLLIVALLVPPRVETAFLRSGEAQLRQMAQSIASSVDLLLTRHVELGRGLARTELFATVVEARNAKQLAPEALAAANRQIGAMLKGFDDHYQGLWLCDAEGIIFSVCRKSGDAAAYTHLDVHDRADPKSARQSRKTVHSEMLILKAIVLRERDAGAPAAVAGSAVMPRAPKDGAPAPTPRGAGAPTDKRG